jgi:hypothetical protein
MATVMPTSRNFSAPCCVPRLQTPLASTRCPRARRDHPLSALNDNASHILSCARVQAGNPKTSRHVETQPRSLPPPSGPVSFAVPACSCALLRLLARGCMRSAPRRGTCGAGAHAVSKCICRDEQDRIPDESQAAQHHCQLRQQPRRPLHRKPQAWRTPSCPRRSPSRSCRRR